MGQESITATFDGKVFRPENDVRLEPNTRVRLIVEPAPSSPIQKSFLSTARDLDLDGPPDWSEAVDAYLYGHQD